MSRLKTKQTEGLLLKFSSSNVCLDFGISNPSLCFPKVKLLEFSLQNLQKGNLKISPSRIIFNFGIYTVHQSWDLCQHFRFLSCFSPLYVSSLGTCVDITPQCIDVHTGLHQELSGLLFHKMQERKYASAKRTAQKRIEKQAHVWRCQALHQCIQVHRQHSKKRNQLYIYLPA